MLKTENNCKTYFDVWSGNWRKSWLKIVWLDVPMLYIIHKNIILWLQFLIQFAWRWLFQVFWFINYESVYGSYKSHRQNTQFLRTQVNNKMPNLSPLPSCNIAPYGTDIKCCIFLRYCVPWCGNEEVEEAQINQITSHILSFLHLFVLHLPRIFGGRTPTGRSDFVSVGGKGDCVVSGKNDAQWRFLHSNVPRKPN